MSKTFERSGDKYDINMTASEAAKLIRKDLKKALPECKFSVRVGGSRSYSAINIVLVSATFQALKDGYEGVLQSVSVCDSRKVTEESHDTLFKAETIANAYHYSESDPMTDYHDVNFYLLFGVGGDRPFQVINKNPRS